MQAAQSHLVQLLLPVRDNAGKPFPQELFSDVRTTLVDRFGGVTMYHRAPAEGIWKPRDTSSSDEQRDVVVVYEVMACELDRPWWRSYREQLETSFGQEQLLIRAHQVERL